MRRIFYWKRLLIVLAVVLVLTGGVFALHRFQAKSQASVIKTRAEQAAVAAEGDPAQRGEAIKRYGEYLKFQPTDEAAFQKYANLLFDDAKVDPDARCHGRAKAANGAEAFLRAFPNHPERSGRNSRNSTS